MEIIRLIKSSVKTFSDEGPAMFALKAKTYLSNRKARKNMTSAPMLEREFADVLFINGCFLPHPARYRVTHQREQLSANGIYCDEVPYTELDLRYIKRFRAFIFYRCPCTDKVEEFIKTAKSFNKLVLFDIDDLVIDTKYTDNIPYLATISKEEKQQYDYGVNAMQKTLRMCDAVITTTEALAGELKNYVPEVFINRNTMSEEMCLYSEKAVYERDKLPFIPDEALKNRGERKKKAEMLKKLADRKDKVIIGYFSGSITHNDDINMLLPALAETMKKHPEAELYFGGELDIPGPLKEFSDRICSFPFADWKELPRRIAETDINIAPLCDTLFNAAKSENKWAEAALVKVPTVASRVGAMEKMITDGETGLLCGCKEEWIAALDRLISDAAERKRIGENAFAYVRAHCLTINTGVPLCGFIKSRLPRFAAIVLPSLQISGGVLVALKHCCVLKKAGFDVLVINAGLGNGNVIKDGEELNVLSLQTDVFYGSIDIAAGTLWSTVEWVAGYGKIKEKAYLVQGYETDFSDFGSFLRIQANRTYSLDNVKYITVSRWCEKWLKEQFFREPVYIPNGLERQMFLPEKRNFSREKIRILIEGNCDDEYKNVDEAFRIADMLDRSKYEIWFLSYLGKPKSWYRTDKFLHRVPYEKMGDIYRECDILLKTSILESFSYPPLEMMATGGFAVVRPNDGNAEYLRDGVNCLEYDPDDLSTAVAAIERIASDAALRETLYKGGLETADSRSWEYIEKDIVTAYSGKEQDDGKQ